jgi:small conductance mechanosensitive channel
MENEIETFQKLIDIASQFLVQYGFQVLGAIIVLVIGFAVARWLSGLVAALGERKGLDVTLARFLGSVVKALVIIFVLIIAMGKFGISVAPFIAALGALVFGASFAIQGPLSNYGAGLTIILTRPFVVGNTITVQGVSGVVEEVTLATSILSTEDGERITIPNKHIVGEILNNSFEHKVVETSVGIAYDDDPRKAIDLIRETLGRFSQVADNPGPQIGIEAFADSSINIGLRYWVPTKQYFQTLYQVNLAVYDALTQAGITIPYPQRDVHMKREAE